MKKILVSAGIIFLCSKAFAGVFDHPTTPDKITLPQYNSVSCKFTQTKTAGQTVIKSGGNFKFNSQNGVVFETLYPVKTTTAYTTNQNKRLDDIITAISKKDFSYLNKNFELYYVKNSLDWQLALKPKQGSKPHGVIKNIIISGSKYIDEIDINAASRTQINFRECNEKHY